MNSKVLNLFGLIAPFWLLLGVTIAGAMYPGYSHYQQAMSELHALGSPVAFISPFINNYPLGLLFIGFGFFVFSSFKSIAVKISAVMIILHGIGSIIAGFFPCDVGCHPESDSFNQAMHGVGAVIMTLTFLLVPAMWAYLAGSEFKLRWFAWLSLFCVLAQIALMPLMGQALESGEGFGLYQRIAYAIPMSWLLVFSSLLLRHKKTGL
ncbi:MAG: DUF998 domain-containing protein [Pseudomonadales bacterium]|nr:DUF998 domain-containing protein [Pseudomonadales bacterium]